MPRVWRRRCRPSSSLPFPLILLGNTLWALLTPWFVDVQYALPGFPLDRDGVKEPLRTELAKTGVASVRPGSDGISLLEEARLANGDAAFARKEVGHMADVRGLVSATRQLITRRSEWRLTGPRPLG